jgi:hypothetical protein
MVNLSKSAQRITLIAILLVSWATQARAGLIVTFAQTGSDVTVTTSGSLNLGGLTLDATNTIYGFEEVWGEGASSWQWISSTTTGGYDTYSGAGPLTVTGGFTNPSNLTVDFNSDIGIWGTLNNEQNIYVNYGYVSGTLINASTTISGITLNDLGMSIGDSQTVSWLGGAGDSITFSAIPEPMSALTAGLAVLALVFLRRRYA